MIILYLALVWLLYLRYKTRNISWCFDWRFRLCLIKEYYVKDSSQVCFHGMIHIGKKDFYDYVSKESSNYDTVITEGIKGYDDMELREMYNYISDVTGFYVQPKSENMFGSNAVHGDITKGDNGFIDDYMDGLQNYISKMFNTLKTGEDFSSKRMKVDGIYYNKKDVTGIIHSYRENYIMNVLDSNSVGKVYIPWGAAHVDGVRDGLELRGYKILSDKTTYVPVFTLWEAFIGGIKLISSISEEVDSDSRG